MKKLKILFINAIDSANRIQTRYPSLGIGYLCASLRKRFPEVEFEFSILSDPGQEELARFNPDIVGISSVSQNFNRAIASARMAKKAGKPIICGGVHISMLPGSLTKDMDVGIIGEGEETICDLVGLFLSQSSFQPQELQKIPGIVFRQADGKLHITPPRPLIPDLDTISMPARDLFSVNTETYMFTSRGCPYRCTFCASSRFWSQVRLFSAEYVAAEIEELVLTSQVKRINFYDDLFTIDKQRVEKIVSLLEAKNILGKVSFASTMRANLVKDDIIVLLKKLGVDFIALGLESGCSRSLEYLKHNVSIEENAQAVHIIKKHGIKVFASFIIGSPQETRSDILETLSFIRKSGLAGFEVYVLTPFPGTPVWDYALSRGLVSNDMDWSKLEVDFRKNHRNTIILSETLTREALYGLYLRFYEYAKWHNRFALLKHGLKHPARIPGFLFRKLISGRK
jgi:anaerobic magnesium-protoporphyrin IX monomethyl ester cyclase